MTTLRDGYRPFFPFAMLLGAVVAAAWGLMLAGRLPAWAPSAHASAMIWGVYGGAVQGFLLTAYPRQNDAEPPSPRAVAGAVALHAAVWVLALGAWAGWPTAAGATALGLLSWGGLCAWSLRIALPSLRKKWDGTTFAVPLAVGAGGLGWGLARLHDAPLGEEIGVYAFLLPLALAVLDRVLPFFSSKVLPGYDGGRRPHFGPLLLGFAVLHFLSPWADLLLAALLIRQWLGWRLRLRVPMIAVLHLGLGWIAAGLALAPFGLGRLPLHLLALGGLGTLVFGISMRVTLGHGGQAVRLTGLGAGVLGLLQLALVLRVAGQAFPGALPWAAAAFAGACAAWLAGFAPLALGLGRAR